MLREPVCQWRDPIVACREMAVKRAASSPRFALTESGEDHAACMRPANTPGSCKNFQDYKSSLSPEEGSPLANPLQN